MFFWYKFITLNSLFFYGAPCCQNMNFDKDKKNLLKNIFFYQSKHIENTNLVIIWGSISKATLKLIENSSNDMLKNKIFIHIKGCSNNTINTSNININFTILECHLNKKNISSLLKEARKCLKA